MFNVVWFKRDLRLRDHAPLQAAVRDGLPVLLVYLFEPAVLAHYDSNPRHWRFVWQSLQDMQQQLTPYQQTIFIANQNAFPFFEQLLLKQAVHSVYSHEETGVRLTFDRDLQLKRLFLNRGVLWREFPQSGIRRGLSHRAGWKDQWFDQIRAPLQHPELAALKSFALPEAAQRALAGPPLPAFLSEQPEGFQPGGETSGWRYLHTFMEKRIEGYLRQISRPAQSRRSCSRLSPYLAWGNLSVRQVFQFAEKQAGMVGNKRNLEQFLSRLRWRDHFIQKFESECRMEFENINPAFNHLRTEVDERLLQAWKDGQTGFPLVDACMRCVKATGYLNFRMRALPVSFLTHTLWQPWQAGAGFLAQQFLD
ncbi:MAG: deoxyribodipyrimidine photo-lyase, partial [Saprospiraceae bacterium]|nr:deoxyribodipyrimidine photo-lyase [Saprospiraceae bacterium]